jgi:hypothetical protein
MFVTVDSHAPVHPVTAALASISAALEAAADVPLWAWVMPI